MTQSKKRVPNREPSLLRNQNSLTQNNLCHQQSRISPINPEFQKLTWNDWNVYTAKDLEILSDIITLATYTSHSSTNITPASYMSLFRAYDVVLSTRKVDTKSDSIYYRFLLKLPSIPGNNWCEKFDNAVKDLGLKSDIEQNSWIFDKSDVESECTIESNISFSDQSSMENTSFDNIIIKINENKSSTALEQKHDSIEESTESTTMTDFRNLIEIDKRSPTIKSKDTLESPFLNFPSIFKPKDYDSTLRESVSNSTILNVDNNIKFRDAERNRITTSTSDDVYYYVVSEEDQDIEELKERSRICFKEWRRFTIKIRAFRAKGIRQWKLAVNFHEKNLLKNYFNEWKINYQKQLVNLKSLDDKCNEFITRKYLIKWYRRKQYVSYMEEQALIIERRNLLKRKFGSWIQKIGKQIELAKIYNNQYCGKLLNELFTKWLLKYKKNNKNKEILNETFKLWRLKFVHNLLAGANQEILLCNYFNMWRDKYFDKIIAASDKYNYIEEGTEETLVQRVFDKWRDRYNNYASLAEIAEDDYNMKLMKNAFKHWRRVNGKNQRVIKEIDMQLKSRYFIEWYSRCLQKWKQQHRQRELAIKVLREWRSQAAKKRRKKRREPTNRELVKPKQKQYNRNK